MCVRKEVCAEMMKIARLCEGSYPTHLDTEICGGAHACTWVQWCECERSNVNEFVWSARGVREVMLLVQKRKSRLTLETEIPNSSNGN